MTPQFVPINRSYDSFYIFHLVKQRLCLELLLVNHNTVGFSGFDCKFMDFLFSKENLSPLLSGGAGSFHHFSDISFFRPKIFNGYRRTCFGLLLLFHCVCFNLDVIALEELCI